MRGFDHGLTFASNPVAQQQGVQDMQCTRAHRCGGRRTLPGEGGGGGLSESLHKGPLQSCCATELTIIVNRLIYWASVTFTVTASQPVCQFCSRNIYFCLVTPVTPYPPLHVLIHKRIQFFRKPRPSQFSSGSQSHPSPLKILEPPLKLHRAIFTISQ